MSAGLAIELLTEMTAGPVVRPLLYGVQPGDPAVIATVVGVLFVSGLLASGLPAWRAGRVDPQAALRAE